MCVAGPATLYILARAQAAIVTQMTRDALKGCKLIRIRHPSRASLEPPVHSPTTNATCEGFAFQRSELVTRTIWEDNKRKKRSCSLYVECAKCESEEYDILSNFLP